MTSKVIVYGSHGKVGQLLMKHIVARLGLQATAIVRSKVQAEHISQLTGNSERVGIDFADLADTLVGELHDQIKGHDAVIVTAGSGGKDLLRVDLDGVVKIFEGAVEAGVRRLVLVSAIFADDRAFISKQGRKIGLENYYLAKYYADRILRNEFKLKLDFTILQPSALADGAGTGKIRLLSLGDEVGLVKRDDVAHVILEVLDQKDTFGKSYGFSEGETHIDSVKW